MRWTVHLEGGPKRVNHAAAVSLDSNNIYSFGGYCTGENYQHYTPMDVHILNTQTYRWTALLNSVEDVKQHLVPYQRYGHTAVAYGHMIYIWGGRNDTSPCNQLYTFSTKTHRWEKPKTTGATPGARDGHSACVIDSRMYVFGGFEDAMDSYSQDLYVLDLDTLHWSFVLPRGEAPMIRDFHTATAVGQRMYVYGGRSDHSDAMHPQLEYYCTNMYFLDTVTMQWVEPDLTGDIPDGRRSHSAFVYQGGLYIFGGFNGLLGVHYSALHRFDLETNEWTDVEAHGRYPSERRRQVCLVVDNKMFLFGGTSPLFEEVNYDEQQEGANVTLYHARLEDHADLHILDFDPSLLTLSVVALIESERPLPPWLPRSIRQSIDYMVGNNKISEVAEDKNPNLI